MVELREGTPVLLRPIRTGDEPRVLDLFASCSHATLRQRFHYTFKPTPETIAVLCQADGDQVLTVVAEVATRIRGQLIGLCRLAFDVPGGRAEYAIMIADDWQGRGLGTFMTSYCLDLAKERGAKCVIAVTTSDNHRMMAVFRDLGFVLDYDWRTGAFGARKQLVGDEHLGLARRTA